MVRERRDAISTTKAMSAGSKMPEVLANTTSRVATRMSGMNTVSPGRRTPMASTTAKPGVVARYRTPRVSG